MIRQKLLIKLFCALFILAACFCMGMAPGFAVPAAAETDDRSQLEISVFAKPGEMVAPGDIMLTFTIENISDSPTQNVYLSSADGLLSEPVGKLNSGEQQSFNRQHALTQEELDDGKISYIISHDDPFDPNGKVNYTVYAQIRRSDMRPQAEFTRRFSSLCTAENSTLTITYHIANTGNAVLADLRVQDSLGDYTGKIDRLEPGESRSLISRVVIDDETVSDAVLDYHAEDAPDTVFTQPLAQQEIRIAQTAWEAELMAGQSAFSGDTVEALLTLSNTGDAAIRNITVTDESYGGVIADNLVLPAGESIEFTRSYALRGEMQFRWKINGLSDTGDAVSLTAASQTIAAPAGQASPLALEVSTPTPRIRRSGSVDVQVRIANPGSLDVQDVILSEAGSGEMYTFAVVPGNDCVEKTLHFDVKQNAEYTFALSYADENGDVQACTAAPLEIVIASDGVLPEGAEPRFIEFTGSSIKIGGSSIFAALLISGLAVLLVLIVLLLIASRRARIEKQLRIAAEKQRRREETGKNSRSVPQRSAKFKTKGR